ncbi:acyltransferase [Rhodoplanes sp. TEM]|uniref:Acyltransferase n=1 Tax=Rhodoplanes tepidamans TaxID=200616 RepID=A0ABT5J6G8_RHOTP|nr:MULTISPECIES: acyltransferase [Rhodoplanes]MDC7785236.1 acyltransferase [Rhodoplanes tepidamans]MDC7986412.1 acyltransferase [Rhodoplanes sp. TEM]MDQ0353494.1 peptidoglycan/LPS O-acetylase OafA/YrhL [Rhodoplanes tepidamans]
MNRLASIQVLRGVAAVLVVVDHALAWSAPWAGYSDRIVATAEHVGLVGVWVFFVISGYIMVRTTDGEFGRPGARVRFLLKRIVRIVPLYWIATFVEIALRARTGRAPPLDEIAASLLFLPYVDPVPAASIRPVLGVGWTLIYEMFFYVMFALVMVWRRQRGLSILALIMLAIVAAGTLLKPLSDTSSPTTVATYISDPIILLFTLGVLVGRCSEAGVQAPWATTLALIKAGVALALAIAMFVAFVAPAQSPLAWRSAFWLLCVAAVAVCAFAGQDRETAWQRPLVWLGDASYSIYLFHFFWIIGFNKLWLALVGERAPLAFVILAVPGAIAVGCIVHVVLERPLTAWLGRRLSRRPASADERPVRGARVLQDPSVP